MGQPIILVLVWREKRFIHFRYRSQSAVTLACWPLHLKFAL